MPRKIKPVPQHEVVTPTDGDARPRLLVDPEAIGVEVSWSFGDGSADAVRMRRSEAILAFAHHGFDPGDAIARELEPDEALRRAREVARDRSWLVVRELAKPNKTKNVTRVLGVYVRRDPNAQAEAGDGWEMVARVRWDDDRGYFLHHPPEGCAAFPADAVAAHGVAEACRLAEYANTVRGNAVNGDVSEALVAACQAAGCVSRRPGGGGVYLVLAGPRCADVVRLLRQLERDTYAGNWLHPWRHQFQAQVQEVYARPLTTQSWGASAEQQVRATVERLLGDLEELVASGAMRSGTMAKRAQEADALMDLAGRCGAFLADRVPVLQAQLARVSEAFRSAASEDLQAAHDLLADLPDPERTERARKAAAERAARAEAKKSAAPPAPSRPDVPLENLLDGLEAAS